MSESYATQLLSPRTMQPKRKRTLKACDLCHQKKIRCDSSESIGNKCSNCVASRSECTHDYATQRNGFSLLTVSQLRSLAQLRQTMDPLIESILLPTYQAPANPEVVHEMLVKLARYARTLETALPAASQKSDPNTVVVPSTPTEAPSRSLQVSPAVPRNISSADDQVDRLAEHLERTMVLTCTRNRFFGPSSGVSLMKSALEASTVEAKHVSRPSTISVINRLRPEFWSPTPWTQPPPSDVALFDFPAPDLMDSLVNLYFATVHLYTPLLHRPTFERNVKEGLHLSDPGFGGVVLAVCAIASRYSNDHRVLLEGTTSLLSCGYKWYRQIKQFHESYARAPSLYELQTLCLSSIYLYASTTPEKPWYLIGFGLRAAQDIGLNRKGNIETTSTIEGELRKRVFWTLLVAELSITAMLGRSPSLNPHTDFDLDLPVDCDDEYWENPDPALAFKQPPGKPSKIAYFNCFLSLLQIHCTAQQFFYAVKRPEPPPGVSVEEFDRTKLADIDSALNAWVDSVPEHLRWDPHPSDPVFFDQSAMLYSSFYFIQILVHRPFISTQEEPPVAFSSLAICTNAARACIRIMETQEKKGTHVTPQIIPLFMAGLMLLLSIWRQRRVGLGSMNEKQDTSAVYHCINLLQKYETRWLCAGRFCDLLKALACIGGLVLEPDTTHRSARTLAKPVKRGLEELDSHQLEAAVSSSQRNVKMKTTLPPGLSALPGDATATSDSEVVEPLGVMRSPTFNTSTTLRSHPPPLAFANANPRLAAHNPQEQVAPPNNNFPLYSSGLSKGPLSSLSPSDSSASSSGGTGDTTASSGNMNSSSSSSNPSLQKQLDDLEAMMAFSVATGGVNSDPTTTNPTTSPTTAAQWIPDGHADDYTSRVLEMQHMLFGQPFSNSAGAPPGDLPRAGAGLAAVDFTSMWTGVPMGCEWDDWSGYMTNMEALNTVAPVDTQHQYDNGIKFSW